MLKLFSVIAAWFEKFASLVRWLASQGKFFLKVFDVFRSTASFFATNADKVGAVIKGTIGISASALDTTIFFALFLNALTKPVYGSYFAYRGMLEDRTKASAIEEFSSNRKALLNFLLGSTAVEGGIGYVILSVADHRSYRQSGINRIQVEARF